MRHDLINYYLTQHKVSIHASVKDATPQQGIAPLVGLVSIHASVKDATLLTQ